MYKDLICSMAVGLLVVGLPNVGEACSQGFGSREFTAQVNANLDWLLCLHNEQVDSLNRLGNSLNGLSDELYLLRTLYDGLNADFGALSQYEGETLLEQELLQHFIDIEAENILLRMELTDIHIRLAAIENN